MAKKPNNSWKDLDRNQVPRGEDDDNGDVNGDDGNDEEENGDEQSADGEVGDDANFDGNEDGGKQAWLGDMWFQIKILEIDRHGKSSIISYQEVSKRLWRSPSKLDLLLSFVVDP